MNSRSVVLTSLDHRAGSLPVDFGGTAVSGIHVSSVAALRKHYGLEERPVKVIEPYQMLGEVDEELKEIIGVDTEAVPGPLTLFGFPNEGWKEWRTPWEQKVLVPKGFRTVRDGPDVLIFPTGDTGADPSGKMPESGVYFDSIVRQKPIVEEELNPEDNLQEFGPLADADIAHYKNATARARSTGRAVAAALPGTGLGDIALVPAPFLADPKGIRDVTEWYISLVSRQDYVHAVFEKQTDIALENLRVLNEEVGESIDIAFVCGTDFGTQTSTFCSPDTFRSLYMPYYLRVNNWIHAHTKWKTFKHSCGAVFAFMPLFIEAGFDIVNPVQLSATGMDAKKLKGEYGSSLVFWGGGVDTQKTLPFGTPEEVRSQVLRRCEILSNDGGFVFNPIHNVQAKTPVANMVAMIDAVKEYRR